MKTSQVLITSFVLLLALGQAACSAKIEGHSSSPSPDNNKEQNAGFDVNTMNGVWKTGCVLEKAGYMSDSVLELSNGNFKATTKVYGSKTKCVQADLITDQSTQGQFKVGKESVKEAGSYELEIDVAHNGYTEIQYDLVRLEDGKMYLGDYSAPYDGNYPSRVDRAKTFQK